MVGNDIIIRMCCLPVLPAGRIACAYVVISFVLHQSSFYYCRIENIMLT